MVICDLNFVSVSVFPTEANPILVIDTDTVLPSPISLQQLQPISWRRCQIAQFFGTVDLHQPAQRNRGDLLVLPDAPLLKDRLSVLVPKRSDHTTIILRFPYNVSRMVWGQPFMAAAAFLGGAVEQASACYLSLGLTPTASHTVHFLM